MAACGSLQHIFENSLPENTALLESLSSWKPIEQSSFTEIFGELHFKENTHSIPAQKDMGSPKSSYTGCHGRSDSFSSMKSESLQLCTEGLGFESSDDVEDFKNEINEDWERDIQEERASVVKHLPRMRSGGGGGGGEGFPPPISCIGKSGKPCVCFKSYRHDGRFVLKEIRIPTQEFLHSCREDGRLKMHFVQPNDDILEENEDEEDDEQNNVEEDDEEEQDQKGDENKERLKPAAEMNWLGIQNR